MYRKLLLVIMGLSLCACPRPQQYSAPQPPIPNQWPERVDQAEVPGAPSVVEVGWREFFADARLQSVIEMALENNRDLRMAALNVERVEGFYRIQRAERYPGVNVGTGAQTYRLPEKMSPTGQAQTVEQYDVNLGVVSWELDLFGRVRSLTSAALEEYLATRQAQAATKIALVAAVANSYLALAADREQLELAKATLETQQQSYEMIKRSCEVGIGNDLDLRQAESQVEAARVDIARYTSKVALDENALNLLIGAPVPAHLLPENLASVANLKDVSAGLPSEALLNRPDILLAEHQLKAAYANIDAARANFFPRISLTGGGGIMSSALSDLFKVGSGTWNFVPQLVLPIFDSGAREASYRVAEVNRDFAVAEYERAIQSAFREVSDALALRSKLLEQMNAQESLVHSLRETYRLSEARYNAGIDSYLGVLVAQRSLYAAQQGLVSVNLARLSNL
ncbi:MAG TPA: efflux transporter outer membrane subunit, partial [Acidobacteriota bacterium]|nr:efflux transporter outer membrane subunit [Acidobacteriota bacterium]